MWTETKVRRALFCRDVDGLRQWLQQLSKQTKSSASSPGHHWDINAKFKETGANAFHAAVARGDLDLIDLMLHSGTTVDLCIQDDESGYTALARALYHGHLRAAVRLLVHQSDLVDLLLFKVRDIEGQSALSLLHALCHERVLTYVHYSSLLESEEEQKNEKCENDDDDRGDRPEAETASSHFSSRPGTPFESVLEFISGTANVSTQSKTTEH